MSTIRRVQTYIDTNTDGLVVQIEHNMNGMVYPEIYTVDLSGAKVFVSLYDPRLAEVKALDANNFQITFASTFAGYLDLLYFDVSVPSESDRITILEKELVKTNDRQTKYTTLTQWKQMNTYNEKKFKDLETDIAELKTLYNQLAQQVATL